MAAISPPALRSGAVMWTASLATPQPESRQRGRRTDAVFASRQAAPAEPRAHRSRGKTIANEIAGHVESDGQHVFRIVIEKADRRVDQGDESGGARGGNRPHGTAELQRGGK